MEPQLMFWLLSIVVALVAFLFKHERDVNLSRPEIILDTIFNSALSIRNVGKNSARNIKEVTGYFRDVPHELSSYNGIVNYYKDKDPKVFRQVDLHDLNGIKPQTSVLVHFEYEDSEGHKFYSIFYVRRNSDISPPWFFQPKLVKMARSWM